MVDCVLIVISYRTATEVALLLATIPDAVGSLTWRVLVVDNDGDEDLRSGIVGQPQAEVLDAGANLGYAGGINLALRKAPASRWTVFLNPDLRLAPGAIERMASEAGDDRAICPAIVDARGVRQHSVRREPTLLGAVGDAAFGARWAGRPTALSETVRTADTYSRATAIDWATGAALLVPTDVVRTVGEWDAERFFLYSEETDYCRRIRRAGHEIRFLPGAVVMHGGGGSGQSSSLFALKEVNRVRYFRKWHGAGQTTAFAAVVLLANLLRATHPRSRAAVRALMSPVARRALPGAP